MRRNDDPPDDGPCHCGVCNGNVDKDECICPECPVCGECGSERCYHEHGLVMSTAQREQFDRLMAEWEKACKDEAEAFAHYHLVGHLLEEQY